jgi:hypothetical protein
MRPKIMTGSVNLPPLQRCHQSPRVHNDNYSCGTGILNSRYPVDAEGSLTQRCGQTIYLRSEKFQLEPHLITPQAGGQLATRSGE